MSVQLCIQPVSPQPGQKVVPEKGEIELVVQVTLNCGMPACAGGRWDPRRFSVRAGLFSKDQPDEHFTLSFSGNAGEFSGYLKCRRPGLHLLLVEARDPETGAAGRMRLEFRI